MARKITEWCVLTGALLYLLHLYMEVRFEYFSFNTMKNFGEYIQIIKNTSSNGYVLKLEIACIFIALYSIYMIFRNCDRLRYYQLTILITGIGLQILYFIIYLHPWAKFDHGYELNLRDIVGYWFTLPCLAVSNLLCLVVLEKRRISYVHQIILISCFFMIISYFIFFPSYIVNSVSPYGTQKLFIFTTISSGPIPYYLGDTYNGKIYGPDWSEVPYDISFVLIDLAIFLMVFNSDEKFNYRISYWIFFSWVAGAYFLINSNIKCPINQWIHPIVILIFVIIIIIIQNTIFKIYRINDVLRRRISTWISIVLAIMLFLMIILNNLFRLNVLMSPWLIILLVPIWMLFPRKFPYIVFFGCEFFVYVFTSDLYNWPKSILLAFVPLVLIMILGWKRMDKSFENHSDIQCKGS